MPKIDMTAYKDASSGGTFKAMEPGIYPCKIVRVNTVFEAYDGTKTAERDQVAQFVVDVSDGEFAGEFSRDFYSGKEYIHALSVGWGKSDIWQLKQLNTVLTADNPGFDPLAAFEADRWDMFVGKKLHVLFNGYERTNDRGYTNVNVRASKPVPPDSDAIPRVKTESGEWVDWDAYQLGKTAKDAGLDVKFEPVNDDVPF